MLKGEGQSLAQTADPWSFYAIKDRGESLHQLIKLEMAKEAIVIYKTIKMLTNRAKLNLIHNVMQKYLYI